MSKIDKFFDEETEELEEKEQKGTDDGEEPSADRFESAMKNSIITMGANLVLSGFKLFCGIFGGSFAMVTDAVHTCADVFSTAGVISVINRARRDGEEGSSRRRAGIISLVTAAVLMVFGDMASYKSIVTIASNDISDIAIPTLLPLIAALISIAAKEAMYQITSRTAKQIQSDALMADAWHHRSDGLSSIAVFAGIIGARSGYPAADSIAALVTCMFVFRAAYDIYVEAVRGIRERRCDLKTLDKIADAALEDERIIGIDDLRGRMIDEQMYVYIEISADGRMSLFEADEMADAVHDRIQKAFPDTAQCMVHVNSVAVEE